MTAALEAGAPSRRAIMRVICAWCQAEGRPALLREVEPLDDPTETHGICAAHQRRLLTELRFRTAAGPQGPAPEGAAGLVEGPGAPGREEMEAEELRRRLGDWMAEGRYVLGHLLPGLLAEHDHLKARAEAAERCYEVLRRQVDDLESQILVLRSENETLRTEQAEAADLFRVVMDSTLAQVLQPMYQALHRLRFGPPRRA